MNKTFCRTEKKQYSAGERDIALFKSRTIGSALLHLRYWLLITRINQTACYFVTSNLLFLLCFSFHFTHVLHFLLKIF